MNKKYDAHGFEDFKSRALDKTLTIEEKAGFPIQFREEAVSRAIIEDWEKKIPFLLKEKKHILDIGPGCSPLPQSFISYCHDKKHFLTLVDSEEMLNHLPNGDGITKICGAFPECMIEAAAKPTYDIIIAYSIIQYVFKSGNLFHFLDSAVSLLKEGGYFLLGDIPNASRRKRFLSSSRGLEHHRQYYSATEPPNVHFNCLDQGEIDDGVILGILTRYRIGGYDCFILPQTSELPMSNRREDIIIVKP